MNMEVTFVRNGSDDRILMGASASFPANKLKTIAGISLPVLVDDVGNYLDDTTTAAPGTSTGKMAKYDKVPRPANAFILYRKDNQDLIKAANPGIHNNDVCKYIREVFPRSLLTLIAILLGAQWANESSAVRNLYKARAENTKVEHLKKNPGYQYRPRKPSEKKRRMTKKKAAALASMTLSTEAESRFQQIAAASQKSIDPKRFFEEPSGPTPDFGMLNGSWSTSRTGSLPLTDTWYGVYERHNSNQIPDGLGIPLVDAIYHFKPASATVAVNQYDSCTINWELIMEEIKEAEKTIDPRLELTAHEVALSRAALMNIPVDAVVIADGKSSTDTVMPGAYLLN